jgi:hypothetical protein
MTLLELKQKVADRVSASRIAVMTVMLTGLVGMASAAALNDSIAPVIIGMTLLFVPLLAVVVAAVPFAGLESNEIRLRGKSSQLRS